MNDNEKDFVYSDIITQLAEEAKKAKKNGKSI